MAGVGTEPQKPPRARFAGCCALFTKLVAYIGLSLYAELTGVWDHWHQDGRCEQLPLPTNQSGVKVLVHGLAKTGTRTMSVSLQKLGLKSYHSEEMVAFVWHPLADAHWSKAATGGRSPIAHPFLLEAGAAKQESDLEVLRSLRTEDLSAEISRCRPDALLFDGIEHLFWPSYLASPDAKVIMLSWRTWQEWSRSLEDFSADLVGYTTLLGVLQCSAKGLPWGLVFRALDPLLGGPVQQLLANGGPPFHAEYSTAIRLWHMNVNVRRIMSHWFLGLSHLPQTEAEYQQVWTEARQRIPPERLFEWDMRRHGWEDLCAFLDVPAAKCPGQGRMPRATNVLCFERDHPLAFALSLPVFLLLHLVNWRFFGLALAVPGRLRATWARRRKAKVS